VIRRALTGRQGNALAGNDIGAVGSAGVGEIRCEVESVFGRAVLDGDDAAGLPVAHHGAEESADAGEVIDVAAREAAADVEEREATFEPQVALVLRANGVEQADDGQIRVIDGFGPYEAGEE